VSSPLLISDVGKLALLTMFILGLFVLVLTRAVEWGEAAPFFTLVAGYLFGNGNAAVRRKAPSSVIVPNVHEDEVLTVAGSYPATLEGSHSDGEI
jgi:hypothetical protein